MGQFLRTRRPRPLPEEVRAPRRAPVATAAVGHRMAALFAQVTAQAVSRAGAEGLAVPGWADAGPVERRPDGTVHTIDDALPWSPTDWKTETTASS